MGLGTGQNSGGEDTQPAVLPTCRNLRVLGWRPTFAEQMWVDGIAQYTTLQGGLP